MKFVSAGDCNETGLTARLVSENGLVEIGIYQVLFGRRVRAGFVGDAAVQIDWCCGSDMQRLWSHYLAVALFLRRQKEDRECFEGLPQTSLVKPCWKDQQFEHHLTAALLTDPRIKDAEHRFV